jgi:hypothetical protein
VSPTWRARFRDLNGYLGDDDSELVKAFRRVDELDDDDPIAADAYLDSIPGRFPDLLPGAAGREVARTIAQRGGERPSRFDLANDGSWDLVDVFERDDPPYKSPGRGRPGRDEQDAEIERLVRDLEGGTDLADPSSRYRAPLSFEEAARRRGLTGKQFARKVFELRNRGVRIRPSGGQEFHVELMPPNGGPERLRSARIQWHDRLMAGEDPGPSPSPLDTLPRPEPPARPIEDLLEVGCSYCEWSYSGPTAEALAAQKAHRERECPGAGVGQ